jgi:cytoskeleton protein RodZ
VFEIGSSLREARTRQSLDFPELELRTKVRAKYLRLLEEERFDLLPAHTYIKGFLRTYAETLGLDGQLYVDEYNSRYVVGEEEVQPRAHRTPAASPRSRARRRERQESKVVVVALVAIAILTALVIAAWKFGGPSDQNVRGLGKAGGTAASQSRALRATLIIRAVRGASAVEVRYRTRAGRPLYSGTLERGKSQMFTQRRLWISLSSPANVVLVSQGKRVAIPRGGEFEFTAG